MYSVMRLVFAHLAKHNDGKLCIFISTNPCSDVMVISLHTYSIFFIFVVFFLPLVAVQIKEISPFGFMCLHRVPTCRRKLH